MLRKGGWKALISKLADHKLVFAISVLLGLANMGGGIALAGVGAWIVGKVATEVAVVALSPALWLLAGLVLATAAFSWLESWLAHDLAYRVLASLRLEVYGALARLAPAGLVDKRSGDVVSTAMADVETLEWFYAHSIGALITCSLVPAVVLVILGFYHPLLPLLLLPLLVMVGILPGLLRQRASVQGKRMRASLGDLNADVVEAVQGLRELALFGALDRTRQQLESKGRQLVGMQLRYGLRAGLESGVSRGFVALSMLVVLAFSAHQVALGNLEPAVYPLTVILAGAVFGPVAGLSAIASQFGIIGAAAERVFHLIKQPPSVVEPERPLAAPQGMLTLRFHEVGFTYEGASQAALEQVSFTIRPGESVALVGSSGAGKSTCARLLLRYYDADAGSVSIGGCDLKDLRLEDLRNLIALVPQDIYLFDISLADNIRLGRPEASDEDVEQAARLAAAHSFISALPNGYQTRAGERGLSLSGGQRQRIAVARAFIRAAPILIMDEAASNLDGENERALQQAMDRLRLDRTTLVIAHRLSTIEGADRVVVLEGGRVVEEGPPARLLAGTGPLARLMHAQSISRNIS